MANEKSRKTNVPQHAIANHQIDYHGACNRTTNKGFRAGQWYRRYRTIICSTLSIFNRGPQIYLRRLPRSLHFTIVRNDAIVSYSFFSPFFFYFSSFSFFLFSFIPETIFFSQWRTVLKGPYQREWIRTSVPVIR